MQNKALTIDHEMKTMEKEPLNEMELKLIKWSLGLGCALLVVFYLLSKVVAA